jgi:hypothetical protein
MLAWHWLQQRYTQTDCTGFRVSSIAQRPDVAALSSLGAVCRQHPAWRPVWAQCLAAVFAAQLYSAAPVMMFMNALVSLNPTSMGKEALMSILKQIKKVLRHVRIQNGALSETGRAVMQNPSERRSGAVKYARMAKELSAWKCICRGMVQSLAGEVRLCDLLEHMRTGGSHVFSGRGYESMRLCRVVMTTTRSVWADTASCWSIWRSMTNHVKTRLKGIGLWQFEDAIRVRNAMRIKAREPLYSFSDLIVFVCLADDVYQE